MAIPFFRLSANESRSQSAPAASYTEHRQRLLAASFPAAAAAVLWITLLYALAELVYTPVRFRAALVLYLCQLVIPPVGLWLARGPLRTHPEGLALGADLAYTATLAGRVLLPTELESAVALFLSLKMVATAVLFPWDRRFQYTSVSVTVLLYCGLLVVSGQTTGAPPSLHLLLGPAVAAALSAVGAATTDRARRAVFSRGMRLAESEAQLRALFDASPDGMFVMAAGRITFTNPRLVHMLNYGTADDLLARSVCDVVVADDRAAAQSYLEGAASPEAGARPLDTRLLRSDGTPLAVALTAAPFIHRGQPAIQVMVRDVTERKRAEDKAAALLQIAKDITGTLELEVMVERVQRRTAHVLPCEAVVTFSWHPEPQVLRMMSHYGIPPDFLPAAQALEFGAGAVFGGRLTTGETVVVNDVRQATGGLADLCRRFGIAALVAAPLRVPGGRLGALVACRTVAGHPFEPGQVDLCTGIAGQLALALQAVELHRTQLEEAEVSAALARVGRELITALDTPALLDRLCQVTAEVLGCDSSHTLFWQPEEEVFRPIAGYGATPEEQEAARVMKVPRAMMSVLLSRLESDDVAPVGTIPPDVLSAPEQQRFGVTLTLCMALRRGTELVGLQVALSRGRRAPFTKTQLRIARGIAQVASLTLEHERVVKELDRASRLKSDFVATMSHELRTPLNVIIGYTDLMLENGLGPLTPEQAEGLERVQASARELLDLINATLDLSRLEAGRMPVELGAVAIGELLHEVDVETRELQRRAGLGFVWNVAPDLPQVHTDPVKVKLVLKNLLGNAAKFTERGTVTVEARSSDGGVEIAVADTGIGIPPEAVPIIFEPFRQADSSHTRRHGGVGLGLYIVRRLLEMVGGTVSVETEVGHGSTFRVWLPTTR